ncbi:response regulator transcription factor [Paenibacillus polygoni]|uniref:Response regulator transcription factor n=1 Tax=Paenibacillus polygoni TaxID=3050112 RepID=A0ABY8XD50_9BACL|nr:response regulator transcription factor [Paenibacillus polygoni]WIV21505.1 response regulator transcription factor [Paenibacillus polygoni]
MKTQVLVVDDHAQARNTICKILESEQRYEVIGVVESGLQAIEFVEQRLPDLILMDIEMPEMNGFEATKHIKERYPFVKIVLVTVSDDMLNLLEALKYGAQGYLFKNLNQSTWLKYLDCLLNEEASLSRELAYEILKEVQISKRKEMLTVNQLTSREQDILYEVARGLTNKEIALRYEISEYTVKNHLKNILQKLQVHNRVQLTRYAMEQGII